MNDLARRSEPATLRTIPTPWTPYAIAFSPDGTRLAIGGGSFYGRGGILLVDCTSDRIRLFRHDELPPLGDGTVSGLCFAADARHLVASVWRYRQYGGRVAVFEIDGLELRGGAAIDIEYARSSSPWALATGLVLHNGKALVRNHRAAIEDQVFATPLSGAVHRGPTTAFGNQRLVVVNDLVITGNQGEPTAREVSRSRPVVATTSRHGGGRLVVAPLTNLASPTLIDAEACASITAVARVGDRLISGGSRGELDAWSLDGRWKQQRLRNAAAGDPIAERDKALAPMYGSLHSIADICAIPHRGAASVSVGGQLCLFDPASTAVPRIVQAPRSPRSLAAHPDGAALAVGIKDGSDATCKSRVVILDMRTSIEPAWCTPAVRSLADLAATHRSPETFAVLADALEQAGCDPGLLRHLRHHDHALASCWAIDALVAAATSHSSV